MSRQALINGARYTTALVGVALAAGVTFAFLRTVGPTPAIGFSYLFAIMAAAWWGGYGPGVLACLLSTMVVPFLFFSNFTLARVDWTRLVLVLLVSLLVSKIRANRQRVEKTLRQANDELEARVQERTKALQCANRALRDSEARLRVVANELQAKNQHLRQANADLEHFAYAASHDLREPMRNVIIFSEMLQARLASQGPETQELLGFVLEGARRIDALIRDLLSYTQAGNAQVTEDVVSVQDALDACKRALESIIKETGGVITNDPLPSVRIARTHLEQVLQNLISNAVKYHGSSPPSVHVSASSTDDSWTIVVADQGIGIPAEHHERIFGVFKRLHQSVPGTGIGLALCKKIIERYGGRIWVESSPGQGARFCFTLPHRGAYVVHDTTASRQITAPLAHDTVR